ncbi:hypothetical protein EX895_002051 [Sporisorium graminicola]|uniref:AB hydrolase-1 domain-containing protein n=1 Tax=Sporisorium graminicola TaxID=280036 RepID=A0A4U7KWD3_9BASI|nr:hypothetical protein EX895_002051 [Sporisorium graminicola]TKY88810.1 hypothetical protein EX895_002051 [Sporisorium graminicola]
MTIRYFELEHGQLAVDIQGEGPLVICAPAMGDLRNAYTQLASLLVAAGYTVACLDNRGHGDSSTDFDRYGDEAAAADFLALIQEINLGPAILIGVSFTAAAATIAAGRRPDLCKGLVLLGPFLRNSMGSAGKYILAALVARPWGPIVWKAYSRSLWPGLGEDKCKERAEELIKSQTRPGRWTAFQKTVSGADHAVVGPWLEKAKDVPVLVVMGDKDPDWSNPLDEAEWVASNFSTAKVVAVGNAGHAPHLECPEVVGEAVMDFLASVHSSGQAVGTSREHEG